MASLDTDQGSFGHFRGVVNFSTWSTPLDMVFNILPEAMPKEFFRTLSFSSQQGGLQIEHHEGRTTLSGQNFLESKAAGEFLGLSLHPPSA